MTPGGCESLRRRRAGVSARVAGDVVRLLGPAATLTPTLSLKGEGGRGARPLIDGWGSASGLGFEGRVDKKTAHPRTESGPGSDFLPRGAGGRAAAASRTPGVYTSLRRRRMGVSARVAGDVGRLLGPAATLTPTLSLKGEGGGGGFVRGRWLPGGPLTLALSRRRDRCLTGGGCPEDPHPNPLPRGEGEEQPDRFDEGSGGA